MKAYHIRRATGDPSDQVVIKCRGIAGENSSGFAYLIQGPKHLLLDRQAFEHCLEDQIAIGDVGIVEGAGEQVHALLQLVPGQLATLQTDFVLTANLLESAVERLGFKLQQRHRNAGVGEVHGNTSTHGPGADHRDPGYRTHWRRGGDTADLARLALGKEHMAQCPGLQ
ncbi:hypothetical protein D3C84_678720 [compost metagenome]